MKDPYVALGVERSASAEEIKKTYRKLALQFHPDKNPGDSNAEERFKEISAAYEILSDPNKKKQFDTYGTIGRAGPSGPRPEDLFGGPFGDVFGGGPRAQRTANFIEKRIEISFLEAALGAKKTIELSYQASCIKCSGTGAKDGTALKECASCNGRGKVGVNQGFFNVITTCGSCGGKGKTVLDPCPECSGGSIGHSEKIKMTIPPGINTGDALRIPRKGPLNLQTGENKDVIVFFGVRPHENFARNGMDILSKISIGYADAAIGTSLDVETIHGTVKLKIPPGTQPKDILKVKEKGINRGKDFLIGNHMVLVDVVIPKKISKEERELLKKIQDIESQSINK